MRSIHEILIALGDDELILGHRDSEWCGLAPILEEDIAFANLALDEIGHANLWYTLSAVLDGLDSEIYPDRLVYFRNPVSFRNLQLVELPNGDWAFTVLRQYLFDVYEQVRLEALSQSHTTHVAQVARKIYTEEHYHLRHSSAWVRRLGLGTPESRGRMQTALNELWLYTSQLFQMDFDQELVLGNLDEWEARVIPFLRESALEIPTGHRYDVKRGQHTPSFPALIREMQSVARTERIGKW